MKALTIFIASLIGVILVVSTSPAHASPTYFAATAKEQSCNALQSISPDGGSCDQSTGRSAGELMKLVINLLSLVAGIVAVIMLIVSGFKYVTSQGDSNQIASAKRSLIYAIAGLVVVAFSQAIVQFVLTRSIGA